jgi:hypothetical protein
MDFGAWLAVLEAASVQFRFHHYRPTIVAPYLRVTLDDDASGPVERASTGESRFGRVLLGSPSFAQIFAPQLDAFARELCDTVQAISLDEREQLLRSAAPNVVTTTIDIKLAQLMSTTLVVVDLLPV